MKNTLEKISENQISQWKEAAILMASLDSIGRAGQNVVVKIDGGRINAPYTVLVSGPSLGDCFFRKDGSNIIELLQEAILFYQEKINLEK